MPSKPPTTKRSRRTHSFGGCTTCRRRHVKCDEVRPACLTCRALGVHCGGYSVEVQWVNHSRSERKAGAKGGSSGRRPTRRNLDTDESRASMSEAMSTCLGVNTVDASLAQLEARSKESQTRPTTELAVGPFGLLNFKPPDVSPEGSTRDTADSADLVDSSLPFGSPRSSNPPLDLDDSLQWADLFELDFQGLPLTMDHSIGSDHQGNMLDVGLESFGRFGLKESTFQYHDYSNQPGSEHSPSLPPAYETIQNAVTTSEEGVLGNAQALFNHYRNYVIPKLDPFPGNSKSPWEILNLAAAIASWGEIRLFTDRKPNHAKMANLFITLASASRDLSLTASQDAVASRDYWRQVADDAHLISKARLQATLKFEIDGQHKAKYKDQLMAILSMVVFSFIDGRQKDARLYLIDAERLLRLRGLAKQEISRKARLLHHTYTWLRIVGESTYVLHDYSSYVPAILASGSSYNQQTSPEISISQLVHSGGTSSHNAKLDDFLRIQYHQSDSDLDIEKEKDAEVGLHDIHLEDSRTYGRTLYKQIYGIPETWLSLLSQTTRLANAVEAVNLSGQKGNSPLMDVLQKRATVLEHMVCATVSEQLGQQGETDVATLTARDHLIRAAYSALIVFFYRRVRNVNPLILQTHVDDILESLLAFESAKAAEGLLAPGTVWPAFIAGCEATAMKTREALLGWVERGMKQSGLLAFETVAEMLKEVWKSRSRQSARFIGGGRVSSTQTWVEVAREKDVCLMLC